MYSTVTDPLFGITWKWAWALPWAGLVWLAVVYLAYARLRTIKRHTSVPGADGMVDMSYRRQVYKMALLLVGVTGISVALLRPSWGEVAQDIDQHERDVVVALDISRSMLAEDYEPHRLGAAKKKIEALVRRLKATRVGLIIFSKKALLVCPLTNDIDAFVTYLDELHVEDMGSGSTDFGSAMEALADTFARSSHSDDRIAVLCTDGEDFSEAGDTVLEKIRTEKLTLCALGIGDPAGAPIPLYDDKGARVGHQKDADGSIVVSRLCDKKLRELAHASGGVFVRAQNGMDDVVTIASWIDASALSSSGSYKRTIVQDRYWWYVAGATVCLALEFMV